MQNRVGSLVLVPVLVLWANAVLLQSGCTQSRRDLYDIGAPGDGGDGIVDMTPCTGIQCNVAACPTGATTSISGTVYDPAGTTPLYDVAVYIPNDTLADIEAGVDTTMQCTSCPAPLSGKPLVTALTDSHGKFVLTNVPAGNDVPLVMQAGKFRRAITIPAVTPCTDNPVGAKDSKGAETQTRLPRSQAEGHIPLIAITTGGCDGLECVVRSYGFADSEFTAPTGTGRIHLFAGSGGEHAAGATGTGTEAYTLWGSPDLYKYDMVVNSCECNDYPRATKGPAYDNMKTYLDHGGRLFASHYQFNWFSDTAAAPDFRAAASWMPDSGPEYDDPFFVDTTFPKGMALDEWLQFVFKGSSPPASGRIDLDTGSVSDDVGTVKPGTTRWIYNSSSGHTVPSTSSGYSAKYLSFNTPFSATVDPSLVQCGRAVYADIHVGSSAGGGSSSVFPAGCSGFQKSQQVTAFEFLFFDLGSCVQDDSQPVAPPPIL